MFECIGPHLPLQIHLYDRALPLLCPHCLPSDLLSQTQYVNVVRAARQGIQQVKISATPDPGVVSNELQATQPGELGPTGAGDAIAAGYPSHDMYLQHKAWYNAQGYYGIPAPPPRVAQKPPCIDEYSATTTETDKT